MAQTFTGSLPFHMTNDFLFKILMQEDNEVLKSVISSFLEIDLEKINSAIITNPISIGDYVDSKEMILDVKAILNDNTIVNLEMQVVNNGDWPERSLSYLCRCFDNLERGESYQEVKGAAHISFLNYTLFQDNPSFYSKYQLVDTHTGKIFSSKFQLNVVDLTLVSKATSEDVRFRRDLWASFFKATTWEEIDNMVEKDPAIKQAVPYLKLLTEDEKFRLQCEAREDHIRREIGARKQREALEAQLQESQATIELLRAKLREAGIDPDSLN